MPTNMQTDDQTFLTPDYAVQSKLLKERKAAAKAMVDDASKAINEKSRGHMVGPYWIRDDDRGDLIKQGVGSALGYFHDREEQTQAQQLADVRNQLLQRMPSETRTLDAIPAGNNPDEQGEQVPMRQTINDQFDQQARKWGVQAAQVPGMENMASSMFSESVKAPGRRMEKQEAREARAAELDAARIARQQEAQANREWRSSEANLNRDDKEAARQLSAEDRAAMAREARADRAANAAQSAKDRAANKPIPVAKQKALDDSEIFLSHIDNAIAALDQNPNAVGKKTIIPDMALGHLDPEGVATRAAVAGLSAAKVHELSGAAVSPAEFARLRPYLPSSGDSAETAKTKLLGLRKEAQTIRDRHAGVVTPASGGQSASGRVAAPRAALDYLKANPHTAPAFKAKFGYLP